MTVASLLMGGGPWPLAMKCYGTPRIKVHAGSRPAVNKYLSNLFEKLNEMKMIYPGTDIQLVYEIPGILD